MKFYQYIIWILVIPIFCQSNGIIQSEILKTGFYFENFAFDWTPINKEKDLHAITINEFRFNFSNINMSMTNGPQNKLVNLKFSGPDISVKDFIIKSSVNTEDWITKEKIRRLKLREKIPKDGIELIAKAVDLYRIDNNKLPSTINDLVINKYVNMNIYPLNDYSWKYTLQLPAQVLATPTQINNVPNTNALIFNWQTKEFQLDSKKDSLLNIPLANWEYLFQLNDLTQEFTSSIEATINPDSLNFDLKMKRGKFRINNTSFSAIPNQNLNELTRFTLPELFIDVTDVILNGTLSDTPIIHSGSGKFRIRNFEVKIPEGIREEPEIQSMLETLGIWNNALMIRLIEIDLNIINQFTGEVHFKFHTPFLKISIDGGISLRQNRLTTDIILHNTEVRLRPISLGVRKWIRKWEKEKGKSFLRKGSTILLTIDGPLNELRVHGY